MMSKTALPIVLLLFLGLACKTEVTPPEPEPEADPFVMTSFLPQYAIDKALIEQDLFYLAGRHKTQGSAILVFDPGQASLLQEIPLASSLEFAGKSQQYLYTVDARGGVEHTLLERRDLAGQVLASYEADTHQLLPESFRRGAVAVDTADQIWFGYYHFDINANPIAQGLGLSRYVPDTDSLTTWDQTNSNLYGSWVQSVVVKGDQLYLSVMRQTDSMQAVGTFSEGQFTMLYEGSGIKHLELQADGKVLIHFEDHRVMPVSDPQAYPSALSDDYYFSEVAYLKDAQGHLYEIGTGIEEVPYMNYPPNIEFFPFVAKNGEVLLGRRTEFQLSEAVTLNPLTLYQHPAQPNAIWVIDWNNVKGFYKLNFPQ